MLLLPTPQAAFVCHTLQGTRSRHDHSTRSLRKEFETKLQQVGDQLAREQEDREQLRSLSLSLSLPSLSLPLCVHMCVCARACVFVFSLFVSLLACLSCVFACLFLLACLCVLR